MKTQRLIFEIQDVVKLDKGLVLAGVNEEWNSLSLGELKQLISPRIIVLSGTDSVDHEVLGVETSSSIVGQLNIFILIPEPAISPVVGSKVFSGI